MLTIIMFSLQDTEFMKYELTFLEEQLRILIESQANKAKSTDEIKQELDEELFRLKIVFQDIGVSEIKLSNSKTFFFFHQKSLIEACNKITESIEQGKKKAAGHKPLLEILAYLREKISDFLDWTKVYFPELFDFKQEVPIHLRDHQLKVGHEVLEQIVAELKAKEFEEKFITALRLSIYQENGSSYHELSFSMEIMDIILSKLQNQSFSDEYSMISFLIQYRVNSEHFFNFAKEYLALKIESKPTLDEQIRKISKLKKNIKLLYIKGKSNQFIEFPNIQESLIAFLKGELKIYRALQFVNNNLIESGIINSNYKVSFSVKQLAFFVHLQMETGIILWQRAKFAHQYIAQHYSTVERETISEKSVRNAHYNHASEDVKKVIAKLGQMLALAQEKY